MVKKLLFKYLTERYLNIVKRGYRDCGLDNKYLKKALISSIGRVILGPIVGYLLIRYFNLTGFAAGVLLIQCSMPSAVLNYLVASIYSPKKIVDSVASTIVVSTIMSFFTIPVVVFFALKYFN